MIKQNINIVGMPILYNILEEIKENLSFKIENFTKLDDFLNFFNEDKSENKNFFIITTISNKDFFINKIKFLKLFPKKTFLGSLSNQQPVSLNQL